MAAGTLALVEICSEELRLETKQHVTNLVTPRPGAEDSTTTSDHNTRHNLGRWPYCPISQLAADIFVVVIKYFCLHGVAWRKLQVVRM